MSDEDEKVKAFAEAVRQHLAEGFKQSAAGQRLEKFFAGDGSDLRPSDLTRLWNVERGNLPFADFTEYMAFWEGMTGQKFNLRDFLEGRDRGPEPG